jgi:L-amino acid N-acyltransferase YncA
MTTRIRIAVPADGDTFAAIYRPAVVDRATSFELDPPDGAEMARRVAAVTARLPWLVCEHDGAVVGYAYAGAHRDRPAYRWSVEVSAYVRDDHHGRGIGRALYTALLAALRVQGYQSAYAGITLPNPASEGFHRALGFTTVGVFHRVGHKHGRWHDVLWLERPIGDHPAAPELPRTFPEVRDDPAFAEAVAVGEAVLRRS